ncbi:hypothetical protein WAX88_09035 [Photobacterium damselae subsp. damselae]|uniref:hypothetical protein n=1 Tax=Photobacterium damselae TaxID=38293 RepID=UPI00311AF24B
MDDENRTFWFVYGLFFCFFSQVNKYFSAIFFFLLIYVAYQVTGNLNFGLYLFWLGFVIVKFIKIELSLLVSLVVLFFGLIFVGVHENSMLYLKFSFLKSLDIYHLFNVVGAVFIVLPILFCKDIQNKLTGKFLVRLGDLSFSIYLILIFVLYCVAYYIYPYFLSFMGHSFSILFSIIAMIFFTFLVSIQFSRIDRFSINFSKKLSNITYYNFTKALK